MECLRMLLTLVCVLFLFTTASRIPRQAWGIECSIKGEGSGVCVDIEQCKIVMNFIAQSEVNDITQRLRKYRCEGSLNQEVCCPSKLTKSLLTNTTSDHAGGPSKLPNTMTRGPVGGSEHPNAKLLPTDCGPIYSGLRITKGNITSLSEFPWAAVLKYDKEVHPWGCGGSLINDRYVLTAAHCIRSKNNLITVRLGEYNFTSDPDCLYDQCAEIPQDFEVSADDAIVHPGYNDKTHHHDIALIRLRKPADMNVFSVKPICLPLTTAQRTKDFDNYVVIGWGATETGHTSPVLLKVNVPKVNNVDCARIYQTETTLTDNQLCAGGRNQQDSCAGDSGGPLMADAPINKIHKTLQYGIVSLGPRVCGGQGFPAIYTRVDKYVNWILDTIEA